MLYWHPTGRSAAGLAPLLHAVCGIDVGREALVKNGPRPDSSLVQSTEDVNRYLNTDTIAGQFAWDSRRRQHSHASSTIVLDRTKWLCKGLFELVPGQSVLAEVLGGGKVEHGVEGVSFCPHRQALELIGREVANENCAR